MFLEPTPCYARLIGQRPAGPVYHYTSHEGLMSILTSGCVWATDVRYFKDSSEYVNAFRVARELVERLRQSEDSEAAEFLDAVRDTLTFQSDRNEPIREERDSLDLCRNEPILPCYVCCFSEELDNLDLWRAFSPQDAGYCFGFDWSDHSDSTVFLGKCIYNDDDKRQLVTERLKASRQASEDKIETLIRRCGYGFRHSPTIARKRATVFALDLMSYAILFKDSAFRSENEWRFFLLGDASSKPLKFRAGQSLLIPFREISLAESSRLRLSEICVGPTRYPDLAIEALKGFVGSLNTTEGRAFRIEIKSDRFVSSSIPYRSF
jgi:hypothetical protein